ncbi:MAG: ABC transporter substrate-binding protein [Patescibacteria group bacterium]
MKKIFSVFSLSERRVFFAAVAIFVISGISGLALAVGENSVMVPIRGGAYHEGFVGQPIALNPIISQNPIDQEISMVVFSRLGELLSVYDASSDGRTFNLKLKEGLKWDDGEFLTSDDVIFTIRTAQNPEVKSPFLKSWQGVVAERGSELQIKLTLPLPYVFFKNNIDRLPIIPKHIFGAIPTENFRLSDYNFEPVGSGPYKFKSFTKRKDGFITRYRFVPNENYAGEEPYIKDFYFNFFQNFSDLSQAIRLHEVNGFGSAAPVNFDVSGARGVVEEKTPISDYYALFFNQNSNPLLKEKNIRLALSYAVNQDEIIREALNGAAGKTDALGLASPGYNPELAKQMLADFKARNKNEAIDLTITIPDAEFVKKTAELIKKYWEEAGADQVRIITFNPSEPGNATVKSRDYEILLFGNILENPNDIFPFWHSSQSLYPGLNLALYNNQRADNLIESVRQTADETKQKDLADQARKTVLADAPAIFLFSLPYIYVHSADLGGFIRPSADDFLVSPADKFMNVNEWYVVEVRVIK